jgi:hypothetical protein
MSVVTPVFTVGFSLATAVESVLKPSFNHFELIVIDQSASLHFGFARSAKRR